MRICIIFISFVLFIPKLSAQSIVVSADNGITWETVDLIPPNAEVNFIRNFKNKLLVGTENEGVFLEGQQIGAFLPGKKVNGLLVNGDDIYVAIYNQGLYKTRNNGFTWERISSEEIRGLYMVNENLLIASDNGISMLKEGQWNQVFDECQVVSLEGDAEHLFAGASKGLLSSSNGGLSWNWVHEIGAVHNLTISESIIYSLNVSGELISSEDWGSTWRNTENQPNKGSSIYDLLVKNGKLIMTNDHGVYQAKDKNSKWKLLHETKHVVYYDLFEKEGLLYAGVRSK
jgi:photosystem II stability/assembly factor-like uncharacterized protein